MLKYPIVQAPSGRIFFRHSSGMGSVMIFNDRGTWRRVLVLDAKYRTCRRIGLYGINIPKFRGVRLERPYNYWVNYYPTGCSTEAPDSWINENILWDPMTSRERCDIWMKYENVEVHSYPRIIGCPAVQYCRSIQVNGIPCDLPNIQTLARIFVDQETIDQMDPTVDEYSEWCLKEWRFSSVPVAWSSTEQSSQYSWIISCDSNCNYETKTYLGGVVPVLEL